MSETVDFSELIPIFPLPNVVLLPRAILPLHVFEHRYRALTRDALAGRRLVAISLLKDGHEPDYHTLHAPIHPIVCVGRIMREEQLSDGRYNFLLQGLLRARVQSEDRNREYRRARLQPIYPIEPAPDEESELRERLGALMEMEPLAQLARDSNWIDLLNCETFSLSDVIDVLASATLQCPNDKQHFLEQPCATSRARCMLKVLEHVRQDLTRPGQRLMAARRWPPECHEN